MNIHKNARLTLVRRIEMVQSIVERGLTPAEAAAEAGVSQPTVRKWLKKGLDNTVSEAIRGHGGMPPRGDKADLTDREVRNAILYMFNPGGA